MKELTVQCKATRLIHYGTAVAAAGQEQQARDATRLEFQVCLFLFSFFIIPTQ